jgi:exosortase E/protease (VPEID-CTERM system)
MEPGPMIAYLAPRADGGSRRARVRVGGLGVLLAVELVALAAAYQLFTSIECAATDAALACRGVRGLLARAIAIAAALAVYLWARPAARADLARIIAEGGAPRWAILLHALGVVAMFAPLALGDLLAARFTLALFPMLLGAGAAGAGALFWLARPAAWRGWLAREHYAPLALAATAFALPDLAELALPLWDRPELTRLTFLGAASLLRLFDAAPIVSPGNYVIGIDGFVVHIARQCSGIEGVALVLGFALLYAALFRAETRMTRFWLVLVPLALLVSWVFNVARIAGLVLIGARVSPELATNGFHSYAGWILFTLLALGLHGVARALPFIDATRGTAAPPAARDDRTAALILPFAAMMLVGAALPAAFVLPTLGYPLRLAVVLPILWRFRRHYAPLLAARPDRVALIVGVGVGLCWIVTRPASPDAALGAALAGFGAAGLVAWVVARMIGAVLLTPLVEELFFRGYVLARLDRGGASRWLAILISSLLFAAPHGRWLAAGLAGVAFALVALGRGLGPAIQAHMAANLVAAVFALSTGDWGAI